MFQLKSKSDLRKSNWSSNKWLFVLNRITFKIIFYMITLLIWFVVLYVWLKTYILYFICKSLLKLCQKFYYLKFCLWPFSQSMQVLNLKEYHGQILGLNHTCITTLKHISAHQGPYGTIGRYQVSDMIMVILWSLMIADN
jgi:hypothetical protein